MCIVGCLPAPLASAHRTDTVHPPKVLITKKMSLDAATCPLRDKICPTANHESEVMRNYTLCIFSSTLLLGGYKLKEKQSPNFSSVNFARFLCGGLEGLSEVYCLESRNIKPLSTLDNTWINCTSMSSK